MVIIEHENCMPCRKLNETNEHLKINQYGYSNGKYGKAGKFDRKISTSFSLISLCKKLTLAHCEFSHQH